MTPQESVLIALTELIDRARLHGEAVLIGGQALRDWHARELHILDQRSGIPVPRTTTDIDLHVAVPDEKSRIVGILESDWRQDEIQSFRFHWRRDATVTLDLVEALGFGVSIRPSHPSEVAVNRSFGLWQRG